MGGLVGREWALCCTPLLRALNPVSVPPIRPTVSSQPGSAHLDPRGTQSRLHAALNILLYWSHAARCQHISWQACQQRLQRVPHWQAVLGRQRDSHNATDAHQELAAVGARVAVQPAGRCWGGGVKVGWAGIAQESCTAASAMLAARQAAAQARHSQVLSQPAYGFCSSTNSRGASQLRSCRCCPAAACWVPAAAAAANSCCCARLFRNRSSTAGHRVETLEVGNAACGGAASMQAAAQSQQVWKTNSKQRQQSSALLTIQQPHRCAAQRCHNFRVV